jgi:formylmethanofuran dehydrogenase subunit E
MKTKQIKEELRLILKDYHYNNDEQHMSKDVVTALENLFQEIVVNSITNSHNICSGCGETIRPDQWSENNFTLCIDCG